MINGLLFTQIVDALTAAITSEAELDKIVAAAFHTRRVDLVAPGPLPEQVLQVVRWAESRDQVPGLLVAAVTQNPTSAALRACVAAYDATYQTTLTAQLPGAAEAIQHKNNTEAHTGAGSGQQRPADISLQEVKRNSEILLEPEQRQLLTTLVAAERAIPRERRQEFMVVSRFGGSTLEHPGLPNERVTVYEPDIEILADQGLLKLRRGRGTLFVTITPQGFTYHDRVQAPEHLVPFQLSSARLLCA